MNTSDTKSRIILQNSISKYSNSSIRRKVVNLAGSLRKAVGLKMIKKIQAARKTDW